jgi:hypothetical protein
MVALMLDLQFKDLSLVGDYVGHYFAIGIAFAYDREFVLPTLKTLYQKHHGWSNASSFIIRKTMCNTNVFGVGMFKDEICFKQINVVSHTFLILIYKTLSIDLFLCL